VLILRVDKVEEGIRKVLDAGGKLLGAELFG